MIESGTLLQDRYLIEKQIGEGGMGAVYAAIDQRFGSQVAIKETFYKHDQLGVAFEREAHLLNSLHHPVLPHVSDYFAENNGYFLVMQFIEGEDLFEILRRDGTFPVKDVLRWTDSLLDALDYLHSQEPPIIHRDIKPQNLKITARGDIILLDFGLAKLNSEDSAIEKSIFGYSRKYSPLEQIQGTGTDARSDIFSLAATAYHLLTGKPPIEVIARAAEIIQGNPDPLRLASDLNGDIPVAVAEILNMALALNVAKRFSSAKEMREALEHAVNPAPVESAEQSPTAVPAILFIDNNANEFASADYFADDVAADNEFVNSDEIENFTALEAFAADVENNSPPTNADEKLSAANEPSITELVDYLPAVKTAPPKESYVGERTTRVVARPPSLSSSSSSRFRSMAILAALLIGGVWTALYFIARTSSSTESKQTSAAQTISAAESGSNPEQSAIITAAPTPEPAGEYPSEVGEAYLPEVDDAYLPEMAEQPKTKSLAKKKEIKKEADDKPTTQTETTQTEMPTKPKLAQPPIENSRSTPPAQTPRRREPPRTDTRPRVAETEAVPDIESIFTGRPAAQRGKREQQRQPERQKQSEQLSDEEWKELRRQRRQERRQRQNGNAIPF